MTEPSESIWNVESPWDTTRTHREAVVACWHLASELVRRNPDRLSATHGWFNEMYDVVRIVDTVEQRSVALLDMNGSGVDVGIQWPTALLPGRDPRKWLIEFERLVGLPSPSGLLPPSSPAALSVRWTATFLKLQAGSRRPWYTTPEAIPDSYCSVEPRSLALAPVRRWVESNPDRQPLLIHLVRGVEEPSELVLSPDGDLWRANGEHHSLPLLHTSGGSITELVLRTVPDLLP